MGYKLDDDEVALILKPIKFDKDGEWSGQIGTLFALPSGASITPTTAILIGQVMFLSAFFDIAHEYPDIVEDVEKRRDEMIKLFEQDAYEEINGLPEVEVQTSGGQVIKFGPTSKTKGSA